MRTLGIDPVELLVLPKMLALAIALPLLTVFADVTGVFGGMLMARARLDVGFVEFIDRFGRELQGASFLIGVGKSFVFALIIALIGCFRVFRTRGSATASAGRRRSPSCSRSSSSSSPTPASRWRSASWTCSVDAAPEAVIRMRGIATRFGRHVVHENLDLDVAPRRDPQSPAAAARASRCCCAR